MSAKGPKRIAHRKLEAEVKRRLRKMLALRNAEIRRLNALPRASGIAVTKPKRRKAVTA